MSKHDAGSLVRAGLSLALALGLAVPDAPLYAGARGGGSRGGGASRGSVSSTNRASTSRTTSGNTSTRTTTGQTRSGESVSANRNVTRSGDEVTVNRNAASTSGASRSSQKTYEMENGRVESVERNTTATNRQGQTANWEGKAERSGAGWEFEGEGKNRYGQHTEVEGAAVRGPGGTRAVADVEGGRYGDRTVAAWKPYGGRGYATSLPAGARPYSYYGRPYYGYGGAYYRPYGGFYCMVPPPYGYCCYHDDDMVAAALLAVAGAALLYSDGVTYEKTYVEGETQYKVVPAPAGASVPQEAVPDDAATVTVAGTTYYYYANTFYEVAAVSGKMTFVVVQKPAGVTSVAALPADVQPKQVGTLTYLVSGGKHYLPYLDPAGNELYVVMDAPKGQAPGTATKAVALTLPAGSTLSVRLAAEVSSGANKTGDRFQGNLDQDLVVGGQRLAAKGAKVYGRVAEAKSGTGTGGAPLLALELTDIEVGGKVLPVATERIQAQGEAKKAGKKVLGGAALGAGIGAAIDGGEGAAWGAGVGAVAGAAAAKKSPGNQVAWAAGSAVQFRTTQPVTVQKPVTVQAAS